MPNFIHEMINMNKSFVLVGTNAKALLENNFVIKDDSPTETPSKLPRYKFTENYANYIENKLEELAKVSGMLPKHIAEIIQTSIANDVIIGERPVSVETRKLLEQGDCMGKPFHTKRKSSIGSKGLHTDDPTNGYIPDDQSLSKLSPKELIEFEKEHPNLSASDPADKIRLTKNRNGKSLEYLYIPLDKDTGRADFIYPNPDSPTHSPTFLYEKDGKEDSYVVKNEISGLVKPLYVLGQKENGKELKYVADYDPLFYATRTFPQSYAFKSELAADLGNITEMQAPLVTALKHATQAATSHSTDNQNPFSFLEEISKDIKSKVPVFTPDGKIHIIRTEQGLVKLINNSLKNGYNTFPNPRWGLEINPSGEFYIPEQNEQVNWKKAHKEIDALKASADKDPENKELRSQYKLAHTIYELTMDIKSHQYRQHVLGNNYDTSEGSPSHITSSNYTASIRHLHEIEKQYLVNYGKKSPTRLVKEAPFRVTVSISPTISGDSPIETSIQLSKPARDAHWVDKISSERPEATSASRITPQFIEASRKSPLPPISPSR